jgi:hypothetical protein
MTAGVNPWTLNLAPAPVGTNQDLLGDYEAGYLIIADSERMADCGPSLIAPNICSCFSASAAGSETQNSQLWSPAGPLRCRHELGLRGSRPLLPVSGRSAFLLVVG